MMNDSVREELKAKISVAAKPHKIEIKGKTPMPNKPLQNNAPKPQKPAAAPNPALSKPPVGKPQVSRPVTSELRNLPTSPTLVEFQPKSAALPEWRLQLQNAVRKRKNQTEEPEEETAPVSPTIVHRTSGSSALKVQVEEEPGAISHENKKVQNALRRIEQSRRMYLVEETPSVVPPAQPESKKDYPFYIASKSEDITIVAKPEAKARMNPVPQKPKLVSSMNEEKEHFDTNKLPPIPAKIASSFEKRAIEPSAETAAVSAEASEKEIPETAKSSVAEPKTVKVTHFEALDDVPEFEEIETEETVEEIEEVEDWAPFSLRFNAGVFDLLICSFASLILLSPFIVFGSNWFTTAGFLAFLATSAVVMFIYMTTSIGLFGRTFGMKLFALELIDIEENDYPTFHQAAVSSSVYLLSLALGGSGFLTIPFTAEKRAVHDLVSGTIVVREFE